MRIVFIGASTLTEVTSRLLLNAGHEVIIIESDKERIDELSAVLDCGFIHGDGTRPALLREAAPRQTDLLFCLTGNDQNNIIASLVGRSLGFPKVVTKVSSEEFEHICIELGLEHTIIPNRAIASYLADMLTGQSALELSAIIKDDARLLSFVARQEDTGLVEDLDLPKGARVICLYRQSVFMLCDAHSRIECDDEVVILTHSTYLKTLRRRWLLLAEEANNAAM
ncbi:MAG: TrkA family potassium uptake protein [Candidatus Competibacteraceae bacterium]|nr:TrkA family potassium uptake protein [Candidatus Competibacteraceae bacterium]